MSVTPGPRKAAAREALGEKVISALGHHFG